MRGELGTRKWIDTHIFLLAKAIRDIKFSTPTTHGSGFQGLEHSPLIIELPGSHKPFDIKARLQSQRRQAPSACTDLFIVQP